MDLGRLDPLIGGAHVRGLGGVQPCVSPFDGQAFAEVSLASRAQAEAALAGARARFEALRRVPAHVRADWLLAMSRLIETRRDALARLIAREVGKPVRTARIEVDRAVSTFRIAAEEALRTGGESLPMDAVPAGTGYLGFTLRQPRGVVFAVTPFNFPLNLLAHKVAPALASGNAILAKPSPRCPLTALMLGDIALEAGVPASAFDVLPTSDDVSAALPAHPDVAMVSFTGSVAVGKKVLAAAGLKRVTLELGSNAANLVCPSADLEAAVPALVAGGFSYAGQSCISVQRIYVHRSLRERLEARLVAAVQALRVGDPLDEATDVGPMISARDAERALSAIDEARAADARILTGGTRKGAFLAPTVIADPPEHLRCVTDEIFAPVVNLLGYDDFDDALARANRSRYGLNAAVFTNDLREALAAIERLEVGTVVVNQSSAYRVDLMPYGGIKESGLGREGLRYAIEEMTEVKLGVIRVG